MKMFWFGRNWKNYVRNVVNQKVLEEAKASLLRYVPENSEKESFYKDKTFIDVGCGSGLFSLSALLLGAKEVISFDIQKESIEALELLKQKFQHLIPRDSNWEYFIGDVLDENLVRKFEQKGDIVYSWGVLHHTGNMWKAIENASRLVKPGGFFIIAIYNHAPSSEAWQKIKRFYNDHPNLQPILGLLYGIYVCLGYMIRRRTFNLYRDRGMHVFYDAIDWIGGYPYEFACFEEVKDFVENLGFRLIKSPTKLPCGKDEKASLLGILRAKNTGCNEFVFKRTS